MPERFYLKVAYNNKIKKYAISNLNQINLPLIHSSLDIQQSSTDSLLHYQLQSPQSLDTPNPLLSQQQLIDQLAQLNIRPNTTIKIKIVEKLIMSQEDNRRKGSDSSLQIPTNVYKKRSKSMEFTIDLFDQTCQTQYFDSTDNFILAPTSSEQLCNSDKNSHQLQVQRDKIFSKSTQIQLSDSMTTYEKSKIVISVSYSKDLGRIRDLFKESMRTSDKRKDQLQRLKVSIAKREQQKERIKQLKQQQLKEVFQLFGINYDSKS